MKKTITLFLFSVIFASLSFGQSLSVLNNGEEVQNNGTIWVMIRELNEDNFLYLDIVNNSDGVFGLMVKREILSIPDPATCTFCINRNCLDGDLSLLPYNIEPRDTLFSPMVDPNGFEITYSPSGDESDAEILFTLFNESDTTDRFVFKVIFSRNPYSVVTESKVKASVLKAYPNPATENVTIQYETVDTKCSPAYLIIKNIMGSVVERIPLSENNGKLVLDISNYSPGLYFYSIESNGKLILTKKLVIN